MTRTVSTSTTVDQYIAAAHEAGRSFGQSQVPDEPSESLCSRPKNRKVPAEAGPCSRAGAIESKVGIEVGSIQTVGKANVIRSPVTGTVPRLAR